jgi:hypothetical protein
MHIADTHSRGPAFFWITTALAVSLLVLPAARAQTIDYEKLLLPTVVNQPQPGAFGSLWVTKLTITNTSNQPVDAYPYFEQGGIVCDLCGPAALSPNTTIAPLVNPDRPGYRGTFFLVDRRFVDQVSITLRAQDLSRESQTWGTAIPVVRENEFTNATRSMNDVPMDSRFRQTLRIYSLDSSQSSIVRVTVYGVTIDPAHPALKPDTLLGSRDFALKDNVGLLPSNTVTLPGFLEISSIDLIASTTGYDQVRIDVKPLDASRIWAFLTVTNNETQHVTVIRP